MKITANNLKEIVDDIKTCFKSNFITNVIMINTSDFVLTNSFNRQNKLFISLNHESPFISLLNENNSITTVMNPLLETLRKEVKNSYVIDIDTINNDRVVIFSLAKNNEFYEKISFKMVLELIPYRPNLFLLDEDNKITFAAHYSSLDSSRPLIKGMEYIPLEGMKTVEKIPLDKQAFKEFVNDYFLYSISKRKKEKNAKLYAVIKSKIKSLNNKISKLEKEIENSKNSDCYKEIGETIYTLNNVEEIKDYLKDKPYQYNDELSFSQNAEACFKKYKKSKRTIEANTLEIEKANDEINNLTNILNSFSYLDEDEIFELEKIYLKIKAKKNKKEVPSYLPSYVIFEGTKIAFGKNAKQNEYLTFKLAKKDYIYLHLANRASNHVVIFNENPNNKIMQKACEITAILSSFDEGEIYYTQVKNVKKGDKPGLVNLLNHKSITIHKVSDDTKNLLIDIKRFS